MPIRFRCPYCNRLLGIATRKAGTDTTCPHCGYAITVPVPQDDGRTERVNLEDVEELLGQGVTEAIPQPVAAAAATPQRPPAADRPRPEPLKPPGRARTAAAASIPAEPVPKARQTPSAVPSPSEDPPLFEGDVDALLGTTKPPQEPQREKPPAASGMDAMSLAEPPRHIIISPQRATYLALAVVVLMALSFAAGMFLKG